MSYDWTNIHTIERYASLCEIYGALLSNRQEEIVTAFFFEDFSLSEIADNIGISRQAVHEHLHKACALLDDFEEKLRMHQKNLVYRERLMTILDSLPQADREQVSKQLHDLLEIMLA